MLVTCTPLWYQAIIGYGTPFGSQVIWKIAPKVTFMVPAGKVITSGSTDTENVNQLCTQSVYVSFHYLELLSSLIAWLRDCRLQPRRCNRQCRRAECLWLQESRSCEANGWELRSWDVCYQQSTCCLGSATEWKCDVLEKMFFVNYITRNLVRVKTSSLNYSQRFIWTTPELQIRCMSSRVCSLNVFSQNFQQTKKKLQLFKKICFWWK